MVIDTTFPDELANKALARTDAGDNATRSHALDGVWAIPSDQMVVVDDPFLIFLDLSSIKSMLV